MHLVREPRQREVGWKCSSCLLGVGKERGKVNTQLGWWGRETWEGETSAPANSAALVRGGGLH